MSTAPTLQDVQTNTAKLVDIGVVYLGQESNLGRRHGVVIGQEEFEFEDPPCEELEKPLGDCARLIMHTLVW